MPVFDFLKAWPAEILLERAAGDPKRKALPIFELSWNHTTLHALRIDRPSPISRCFTRRPITRAALHMHERFGDEVMAHLEFVRFDGQIACLGLPIVRFTEARLDEIMRHHEEYGCPIFNPHAFTLEEGGMKQVDRNHLAFKRKADPEGLLNPGKMLGWDDPSYSGIERQVPVPISRGARLIQAARCGGRSDPTRTGRWE